MMSSRRVINVENVVMDYRVIWMGEWEMVFMVDILLMLVMMLV